MEDYTNEYGGMISFDDDTCLYSSADGDVPVAIPVYDE